MQIATNKKAFHDFIILDKFEAGLLLKGSEVKALRARRVNLKDSFIRIIKSEIFLLNAHISYLQSAHAFYKPDERAARKLLMHRKQIDKLFGSVSQDGYSIVPLSIYFNNKNLAKIQIALAKGKNLHDKRQSLKEKQANLEAKAAMKRNLKDF